MTHYYQYIHLSWLYWGLVIAYAITILSIIGVILSENRNPLKSLAWVTVLLLFPVGGVILYIFFGRSIKNKRMISRRNKRKLRQISNFNASNAPTSGLSPELRQQVELGLSLCDAPYTTGNDISIFNNGEAKFNALLDDIRSATKYVLLQYYIIENDTLGNRIIDALKAKVKQGVKVRIIYDHIGSYKVKSKFFKQMREAGIDVHPFFRVAFPPFATRINWRNHRKLCIIDGKTGYIGGMNIADRYIDGGKFRLWRDCHMRVTGPAVSAMQYSFAVDWSFMGQPLIEEKVEAEANPDKPEIGMQLLTSGPTSEWSNIAMLILKAIGNAKKRVYIQTPYFLPTESLLRTLQAAALARVDVRVMMPLVSDSLILTYASRSYIMQCLRAGIKIYMFNVGMLHSKTLIIDDDFCSIGSANMDFRSFEHNFESTMFIYSREVNAQLTKQFLADMAMSQRVNVVEWRNRSKWLKAKESMLRLLSPIL